MDHYWLLVIILALIATAFSSGMEIAFITVNKLKIELDKKQGVFASGIISHFIKHPKMFITTMLVGNNIAIVVYGVYMGEAIDNWLIGSFPVLTQNLGNFGMLLTQTLISTVVILVFAEFIPKAIFSINPNRWLNLFAVPIAIWYGVMYVFAKIVTVISDFFLKTFFKKEIKAEEVQFGRIDLDHYLKQAAGNIDRSKDIDHEIQIFQNALDFSNVKARDCLVPRNELVAVDINESIDDLRDLFVETRLSKILIYRDNIDHIIGYVHSFELFKKPANIQQVLRPVSIIPEPMAANEILKLFIQEKKNIAVVVDEFGGTAGVVTMEDIVEEIFGEIEDEHDKEDTTENEISPFVFEFSARLEIDYLNEKYNLHLPENDEEYDTLGGLILFLYGDIPEEMEIIHSGHFSFIPIKVSETKIEIVRIQIKA